MMRQPLTLLTLLLLAGCLSPISDLGTDSEAPTILPQPVQLQAESDSADTEVRQAVQRSLPYLEEHGVAWIEKHQCTTCHQIPVMIWSHHAAARRGLEVDSAKLDEWTRWVLAESHRVGADNSDGIAHLILGRPEADVSEHSGAFEELAAIVAGDQRADGSWKAGGQLPQQRRSKAETHRIATAWAVLALASTDTSDEAVERGREQLEAWSAGDADGESLEWLIVQLLTSHRFADQARAEQLLGRLLGEQNADGGWGWLLGEPSDAFATGQSLYALALLGRAADDTAVAEARRFLLDTQEDDGSWNVRSTLRGDHGVTPTGIYWGTGWAAIGLLSTLPQDEASEPVRLASSK